MTRLGQFRHTYPDRTNLTVGASCAECGTQMDDQPWDAPCPNCGSHERRLPRAKGQVVGDEVDGRTIMELEKRPAGGTLATRVSDGEWETLAKIANTISGTEFVPSGLRGNKPAVMACLLFGRDMGLSPMVTLRHVSMIDGKPALSAELMVAKIRDAGHKVTREEVLKDGNLVAMRAHGERCDDGTKDTYTFTLAMADRAGLLGKTNWKKYPEAMLWARAVSQLARFLFSDLFIGFDDVEAIVTADEAGAVTDEDGEVVAESGFDGAPEDVALTDEAAVIAEAEEVLEPVDEAQTSFVAPDGPRGGKAAA